MISRLTGILAAKRAPQILIDCNGVGYEADVSMTTYYQLPEVGQQLSIWTHLLVKDDSHSLVGFSGEAERRLFRQLIRINGVGPKMALAILSGIDDQQFALCIANGDVAMLTRLPGVGKKTAERLIIEMRDRIDRTTAEPGSVRKSSLRTEPRNEAFDALISLGYRANEINRLLGKLDIADKTAEDIIRLALRQSVA